MPRKTQTPAEQAKAKHYRLTRAKVASASLGARITPSEIIAFQTRGACSEGLKWAAVPGRTWRQLCRRYGDWLLRCYIDSLDPHRMAACAYYAPDAFVYWADKIADFRACHEQILILVAARVPWVLLSQIERLKQRLREHD